MAVIWNDKISEWFKFGFTFLPLVLPSLLTAGVSTSVLTKCNGLLSEVWINTVQHSQELICNRIRKKCQQQQHAGEVAATMAALHAKNLLWRPHLGMGIGNLERIFYSSLKSCYWLCIWMMTWFLMTLCVKYFSVIFMFYI